MKILNSIQHGDEFLLKTINSSIKCRFLDIIMITATYLASKFSLIIFCLVTALNPNPFIHLLGIECTVSLILSTVAAQIFKKCVSRDRPFLIISDLNTKKIGIDKYSFPSGHTTAAFTIAVMISMFYPSITILLLCLSCIVGMSRIYLGVHYPTDVLAGAILGILSAYLVFYIM